MSSPRDPACPQATSGVTFVLQKQRCKTYLCNFGHRKIQNFMYTTIHAVKLFGQYLTFVFG